MYTLVENDIELIQVKENWQSGDLFVQKVGGGEIPKFDRNSGRMKINRTTEIKYI